MRRRALVLVLVCLATLPPLRTPVAEGAANTPIAALSAACRDGKAGACLEAGNRYRFGQNAPLDPALAAEHYDLACRGGQEYGCKSLHEVGIGFLRGKDHRGKNAVEDHGKAAKLFELSCSGGYGPGCTSLGEAFVAGDGVTKSAARATELFVLGCDKGSRRGCRLAGDAFVGTDVAEAREFYEQGCRREDAASCAALGRLHLEGQGAPKDAKRAFDYFLRSCDKAPGSNDAEGCFSLARMYDTGSGGKKDREEAVRLYRQVCTVLRPKKAEACYLLAQAFKGGDGIGFDANAAGQYFRQACELGSDEGCREWRLDSCNRLGDPASCGWLEKRGLKKR